MLDKISWKSLLSQARKGDANAQNEVGDYFSFGHKSVNGEIIVKQNLSSAFSWYQKAAASEVINAITNLADLLSEGKGCEQNIPKAVEKYLLAIDKGSSRAAFNLGTIYRDNGNYKKAFEYYFLANKIDKGDYSLTIGLCYYYGVGVPIDKKLARKNLQIVSEDKLQRYAQCEIDEANYILGLSYLIGEGVKKSIEKSRAYLKLANIDKDHSSAEKILFIIGQNKH